MDHRLFLRGFKTIKLRERERNLMDNMGIYELSFWNITTSCLVLTLITEGFDHFLLLYLQRIGGSIYLNAIICGLI